MARKKRQWLLVTGLLLVVVIAVTAAIGMRYYRYLYHSTVASSPGDKIIHIATGSGIDQLVDTLLSRQLIEDEKAFRWVAEMKKYDSNIKPGRYRVPAGLNNDALVNLLRSGKQEPVQLIVQEVRTLPELALLFARQLEPDSAAFMHVFQEHEKVKEWGFNDTTIMTMFLPNTYEFYWNTSAGGTLERMYKEYDRFWTRERDNKAAAQGLNRREVYTLASIVYAETKKKDEAATIAGVYLNRINRKMPLEADPTLIFAKGDFTIRRVLNEDKLVDSPYNTYRNLGLQPGPINMPPIAWIDAVLNAAQHDYIFFCAREDFSGYHNFAATLSEHNRNAARYRHALNQRRIYR